MTKFVLIKIFSPKIFIDHIIFLPIIFLDQFFFLDSKNILCSKFFGPTFFQPIICLDCKFFGPKICLDQNLFLLKNLLIHIFLHNFFSDPEFFVSKVFSSPINRCHLQPAELVLIKLEILNFSHFLHSKFTVLAFNSESNIWNFTYGPEILHAAFNDHKKWEKLCSAFFSQQSMKMTHPNEGSLKHLEKSIKKTHSNEGPLKHLGNELKFCMEPSIDEELGLCY